VILEIHSSMRKETASESYFLGERAIVVGGGLGGLSAARALSDRFRQVGPLEMHQFSNCFWKSDIFLNRWLRWTPRRSLKKSKKRCSIPRSCLFHAEHQKR
jgi:hypothetical protein